MRPALTATTLALCVGLTACASSTAGTGSGSGRVSVTEIPSSSADPVPTVLPVTSDTAAPSVVPPSSAPPPVGPTTPPAVAPPRVCASVGCTKNATADLDAGYAATLYTAAPRGGSFGSSVLELSLADVAVWWQVTPEVVAGQLVCAATPRPNCVVVNGAGAHASVATGYVRQLNRLVRFDQVESDTPSTDAADLNGDGLIDVVTAINTYEPSYATGTVYWQTFQSTGTALESTGCTGAQRTLPPEPVAPLTGACPR